MFGLDQLPGTPLSLDAYRRDFNRRQWEISGQDSWKLERQQVFQEPGFRSWERFSQGDWPEALHLIEEERTYLQDFSREVARHRIVLYRVRIVEEPIAPYLQWELHLLRLRAECGEKIRVLSPGQLRGLEDEEQLPELLTLGDRTLYQIQYSHEGVLDGAIRYEDRETVAHLRNTLKGLFEAGEDLESYFRRAVAPLPPPVIGGKDQRE